MLYDIPLKISNRVLQIYLSWNVNETNSGVYDFYVGISSTKSKLPDLMDFKSSDHHTHLAISHPNLNEGALFYIIVKSLSRSSVENVQVNFTLSHDSAVIMI